MFPDQEKKSKPEGGSKDSKGGKPKPKQGPGAQQELHNPAMARHMGPKPGQGMDPHEAMMNGIPDLSMFGPPPPAPGAPMGPGGLPVGGNLPISDPGFDPSMQGSSLFKALNMGLDPYASGPEGHGTLDPMPNLNSLLALLALSQAGQGMGALNPSGVMNEPTSPGHTTGLNPFGVIQ